MLFDKKVLKELVCGEWFDGYEVIEDKIIDTSRWSNIYEMVFTFEGKFYSTKYSTGATEYQDESPFEYSPDQVECVEVVPVEKTVIVYEPKEQANG